MKFRVLAFAVCAATCSQAANLTLSNGCTSSIAGATTINFGAYGSPGVNDAAGHATYSTPSYNEGSDPGCGGAWLSLGGAQTTSTVTFDIPLTYFGFYWGTVDNYNSVTVYNGADVVATFLGQAPGTGGNTDTTTAGFYNITAQGAEQFTSIQFTSTACCFEIQNNAYVAPVVTEAVPEPTTIIPVATAAGAWVVMCVRRRRGSQIL